MGIITIINVGLKVFILAVLRSVGYRGLEWKRLGREAVHEFPPNAEI